MSTVHSSFARRGTFVVLPLLLLAGCSGSGSGSPSGESSPRASEAGQSAGLVEIAEDGLPQSYPREDAPIIDGNILSVVEAEKAGDAFVVVLEVTGQSRAEAVADAVTRLENTGWDSRTDAAGEPPPPQVLVKGDGQVVITNGVQRDETSLTYSVVPS